MTEAVDPPPIKPILELERQKHLERVRAQLWMQLVPHALMTGPLRDVLSEVTRDGAWQEAPDHRESVRASVEAASLTCDLTIEAFLTRFGHLEEPWSEHQVSETGPISPEQFEAIADSAGTPSALGVLRRTWMVWPMLCASAFTGAVTALLASALL